MIVNKRDSFSKEVSRLHRSLQEIQFQLANVKLEGKLQAMLEIVERRESDNKLVAFERIRHPRRKDTTYVAMLAEISTRRIINSIIAVRQRLQQTAFVRIRMLPAVPRPLLPQKAPEIVAKQRHRDIVPSRK